MQSDSDSLYYNGLLKEIDSNLTAIKTSEQSWNVYNNDALCLEDISSHSLDNYINAHISFQKKNLHFTKQIDLMLQDLDVLEEVDSLPDTLTTINHQLHTFLPSYRILFEEGYYKVRNHTNVTYKTSSFAQIKNYILKLKDYYLTQLDHRIDYSAD